MGCNGLRSKRRPSRRRWERAPCEESRRRCACAAAPSSLVLLLTQISRAFPFAGLAVVVVVVAVLACAWPRGTLCLLRRGEHGRLCRPHRLCRWCRLDRWHRLCHLRRLRRLCRLNRLLRLAAHVATPAVLLARLPAPVFALARRRAFDHRCSLAAPPVSQGRAPARGFTAVIADGRRRRRGHLRRRRHLTPWGATRDAGRSRHGAAWRADDA